MGRRRARNLGGQHQAPLDGRGEVRARPHVLSARLDEVELGQYVRALAAPGGGWFVPSHFARWSVLRSVPDMSVALQVDAAVIATVLPRFRKLGRGVNVAAFTMNTGPARPDLTGLAAAWPAAAAAVLVAVVPIGTEAACPVPVQFTAPSVARPKPPGFQQKGRAARRRAPGEKPLRETVVATRLSGEEFVFVNQAAERFGADTGDYFRARLLGCDPLRQRRLPRPAARALAAALEECGRQATNFRQLLRAHERRHWPVPPIVEEALATLWDIRAAIVPTLARWRE